MIRVLVSGAAGRMGRAVVTAVLGAEDLTLVAAVDPAHEGQPLAEGVDFTISGDLAGAIEATSPDVMVDFTHPSVVAGNIATALGRGVHCVVGTTGIDAGSLAALAEAAPAATCLFVAPNFALGAVLMMRFAAEAAKYLPHVEIVELHHDKKADAPSGTALRTAALIAETRALVPHAPGRETEVAEGARGALVESVTIHSVRLPGLVAHQEVLFGGQGQTLAIRHDSIDRTSFMPGVLLGIRGVIGRDGLVVGLEQLMDG